MESWPKTGAHSPHINVYETFAPQNLCGDQEERNSGEKQQSTALMQCHLIQLTRQAQRAKRPAEGL